MCIYRLEVSYKIINGSYELDEEISNIVDRPIEYSASGFGWRDLVFSFKTHEERKHSVERLTYTRGFRITLYEKEAA
jgi:hypothetical protein